MSNPGYTPYWGHQAFGIEIEINRLTIRNAVNVVNRTINGTNLQPVNPTAGGMHVRDSSGRSWRVVRDGSVPNGCEVVSPKCQYTDIDTVQNVVRALRRAGATVDHHTGIHIHIDASAHNGKTLATLSKMVAAREDLLFKALNVLPARRRYAGESNDRFIRELVGRRRTRDAMRKAWYKAHGTTGSGHYDPSRYHGLNLHSVWNKGTVEFRYFNGSLHAGEVRTYINFCLALSHRALMSSGAAAKRRCKTTGRNGATQYRVMFGWLGQLGFKGPEWKTVRQHMLKNLSHRDSAIVNG